MEYIVYFHIERDGLFLCTNKSFDEFDSKLLYRWESIDTATKYIQNKDNDKVRCSLWKIGSKELKDWLNDTAATK
jgi:hypothetical protein